MSTEITCRCGIASGQAWIESPRTGKRVSFTREILPVLPRVWGKIVAKAAVGSQAVPFTVDELKAVKSFADAQAKPQSTARHYGMNARGMSDYCNDEQRSRGYCLRNDDTFDVQISTTFGPGIWFRHPVGPAMSVRPGPELESLPAGLLEKFEGKSATFTGAELNLLYAACTAMHKNNQPIRRYRRGGF